jgi:hypothetical protein
MSSNALVARMVGLIPSMRRAAGQETSADVVA